MNESDSPSTVLCAAAERYGLFEALRDGAMARADVEQALDVSRSTAHRVLREFEVQGVVERRDGAYRLTAFGDVVAAEAGRAVDTIGAAQRLSPLLEALTRADGAFDLSKFRSASVTTPTADDPYRPVRQFLAPASDADRIREFDPTVPEPAYQRALAERAGSDLTASILYPPSVVEYLEADGETMLEYARAGDCFDVRVAEVPAFRLVLGDERAYVGGYDDEGTHMRLVVDTDDRGAVEWASEFFDAKWADATPYGEYRDG
ncbi:helix-turn-helix transcriptional regulator [Halobacterium litoreum]|uniref:Helix-turn-helix transcriptional regulator n=1 Tax=Halobacterium litoreum TaxID=2039234 RepID=A0ABD5NCS5_9EURY|nr:helix-turn-helix domain-containing protein [Halobacterium litoreum]UHH14064.1 hypothetical protein LT972_03460 [Halobacterium litoreum]